jgi:hypothetical protein
MKSSGAKGDEGGFFMNKGVRITQLRWRTMGMRSRRNDDGGRTIQPPVLRSCQKEVRGACASARVMREMGEGLDAGVSRGLGQMSEIEQWRSGHEIRLGHERASDVMSTVASMFNNKRAGQTEDGINILYIGERVSAPALANRGRHDTRLRVGAVVLARFRGNKSRLG